MKRNQLKIKPFLDELTTKDSEWALKAIFMLYRDELSKYIYFYVKSKETTEELLSDVFISIWTNRKSLSDVKNFNAYIYKIAKYKALNYLRTPKLNTLDISLELVKYSSPADLTTEDEIISNELFQTFDETIESLPPKCKDSFKLVRESNLKHKDAAKQLGISVKTLESHLNLAIKKIRKKFEHLK